MSFRISQELRRRRRRGGRLRKQPQPQQAAEEPRAESERRRGGPRGGGGAPVRQVRGDVRAGGEGELAGGQARRCDGGGGGGGEVGVAHILAGSEKNIPSPYCALNFGGFFSSSFTFPSGINIFHCFLLLQRFPRSPLPHR